MKIKRILAKRICLIAGTVLSVVIGGQLSAQTMIAKKAKVYAVADAHLDAMELGHSNYYQRVYLEHFEPKSISFESISQLYF